MIRIAALLLALAVPALAQAQTAPNWPLRYVPTPQEWNSRFGGKLDLNGDVTGARVTPRIGLRENTVQRRAQDALTFRDYGAICDGNSHLLSERFATLPAAQVVYPSAASLADEIDGRAIQTAASDTLAPSVRGIDGACRIDRTITWNQPKQVLGTGRGPGGTTFQATTTTGDLFVITSTDVTFDNVRFTATAQRVGGAYVRPTASYFRLTNWYAERGWDVVNFDLDPNTGTTARAERGVIYGSRGTNISMLGGFDLQVDDVIARNDPANPPLAGLYVRQTGDARVTRSQFLQATNGCLVDPGDGQFVASLWFDNSHFDTSVARGCLMRVAGTGHIVRFRASNSWFGGAAQQGIRIELSGTGEIAGLDFENPHIVLNGDAGISTTGAIRDLNVSDAKGGGNGNSDMSFGPGADGLSIRGGSLCTGMGMPPTKITPTGIYMASGINNYLISGVRAIGCTAAALTNFSSGAASKVVVNNLGF